MLLFMDGQAHYDTTRIAMKYSAISSDFCTWSVVPEGRFGNCLKRVSTSNQSNNPGYLAIAPLMTRSGVWTPTTGGVCGFAVKVDDLEKVDNTAFAGSPFFLVIEGGIWHLAVTLTPSGTFTLYRNETIGSADALLRQSTEGLQSNTWAYIEFKWLIHTTAGSFEIRVNGVTVLTFSGETQSVWPQHPNSLGIWNTVRLLSVQSTPTPFLIMRMCDLYLADLASGDPDDVSNFLGDGVIQTIMPNAPGSSASWTSSAPGTLANWDATNDRPAPNNDTDYVVTNTVNALDSYNFEDIPVTAVVKGAHINIMARKETEGASSIAPVVNATVGPTQGISNILYDRYITQPYDLNPATMNKFTAAEINAAEFGVKKIT